MMSVIKFERIFSNQSININISAYITYTSYIQCLQKMASILKKIPKFNKNGMVKDVLAFKYDARLRQWLGFHFASWNSFSNDIFSAYDK